MKTSNEIEGLISSFLLQLHIINRTIIDTDNTRFRNFHPVALPPPLATARALAAHRAVIHYSAEPRYPKKEQNRRVKL